MCAILLIQTVLEKDKKKIHLQNFSYKIFEECKRVEKTA